MKTLRKSHKLIDGMNKSQKILGDSSIPKNSLRKRYAAIEHQQLYIAKSMLERKEPLSKVFEWWEAILATAALPTHASRAWNYPVALKR